MKSKLEKWGRRVTVEPDGGLAFDLAAKELCHVVILECDLPGLDGLEPGTISPEVSLSATNFPQGDLDYPHILAKSERIPCLADIDSGTAFDGATEADATPNQANS